MVAETGSERLMMLFTDCPSYLSDRPKSNRLTMGQIVRQVLLVPRFVEAVLLANVLLHRCRKPLFAGVEVTRSEFD